MKGDKLVNKKNGIILARILRVALFVLVFSFFFLFDVSYLSAASEAEAELRATYYQDGTVGSSFRIDYFSDEFGFGYQPAVSSPYFSVLYFPSTSVVIEKQYVDDVFVGKLDVARTGVYSCGGKTYTYKYVHIVHSYANETTLRSYFKYYVPFYTTLPDGHNPLMHKLFNLADVSGGFEPEYPFGTGDGTLDKKIAYPLSFLYKRETGPQISQTANDYYHSVRWRNPKDVEDCKLQLQYKGTYKVKKSILSKWETVEIDYLDIAELDVYDLQYKILSQKFDNRSPGVVYQEIVKKCGYKPFQLVSSETSQTFRTRYIKRDGDKFKYGLWVRCTMDGKGETIPVVTDDKDEIVDTPEYGVGVPEDASGSQPDSFLDALLAPIRDFFASVNRVFDSLKSSINSLISNIGQVPALFAKILSFLPTEIWGLISVGIGIVIILRVLGR